MQFLWYNFSQNRYEFGTYSYYALLKGNAATSLSELLERIESSDLLMLEQKVKKLNYQRASKA